MMNRTIRSLTLAAGLATAFSLSAGALPDHYPAEAISKQGVVHGVDLPRRTIKVSATNYSLATNVKVHSPATEFSSLYAVKPGVEIGFSTSKKDRHGRKIIDEIWVLPEGTYEAP